MKKAEIKLTKLHEALEVVKECGEKKRGPREGVEILIRILKENLKAHDLIENSINATQVAQAFSCQLFPDSTYIDLMLDSEPDLITDRAIGNEKSLKEGVGFFAKNILGIDPNEILFDGAAAIEEHLVHEGVFPRYPIME